MNKKILIQLTVLLFVMLGNSMCWTMDWDGPYNVAIGGSLPPINMGSSNTAVGLGSFPAGALNTDQLNIDYSILTHDHGLNKINDPTINFVVNFMLITSPQKKLFEQSTIKTIGKCISAIENWITKKSENNTLKEKSKKDFKEQLLKLFLCQKLLHGLFKNEKVYFLLLKSDLCYDVIPIILEFCNFHDCSCSFTKKECCYPFYCACEKNKFEQFCKTFDKTEQEKTVFPGFDLCEYLKHYHDDLESLD